MEQRKAIVIGAGVSGLASAVRLQAQGFAVTVLEKNGRAGGRMGLIEQDGFQFDLGPTIVIKAFEQIRKIGPLADFEKHVISERSYTPLDFKQDFNAAFGATFGLRPTLLQSNYWRPQPKAMNYENLYFTGSSAHPGAGVPIVLNSAKLAVAEIVRDAASPDRVPSQRLAGSKA